MIRKFNSALYSINAAALLLGAAGLLSRLLGMVRDRMLAGHFGASRELDIYYAAFQIPDFFFSVFLLGAASMAIIPVLIELTSRNPDAAKRFIEDLLGVFFLCAGLVGLLVAVFVPYIMHWMVPGFGADEVRHVILLTRIMMVSPILLGLSGIVSSVIQISRRFFVFALAPVCYNIGIIAGIIFFLPVWGLPGLAFGVIVGALLHLLIQLPTFFSLGFRFPRKIIRVGVSPPLRRVFMLSFPRVIALSVNQFVIVVLIGLASTLASGSIVIFQFAYNLQFLPVGIFGVSFATAAFPALAEAAARRDRAVFSYTFRAALHAVLFWILPLSVLFFVLRAQVVRVALGTGNFDWSDTRLTAASLGILTLTILAESVVVLLIRAFYALENTWYPFFINVVSAVIKIGVAFGLLKLFLSGESGTVQAVLRILKVEDVAHTPILAVALAVSLGSIFNMVCLLWGLSMEMKHKFVGRAEYDTARDDIIKMVVSSIAAGMVCFGTLRMVNIFVTLDTFFGVFVQGSFAFLAGALSYGVILYMFGNREIERIVEMLHRRLFTIKTLPRELDGQI